MRPAYAGLARQHSMGRDLCLGTVGVTHLSAERVLPVGRDLHLLQQRTSANFDETLVIQPASEHLKPFTGVAFLQFKHPSVARASGKHSARMQTEGDPEVSTEIYLIRHAESSMNVTPELLGGRSPWAVLTPMGQRQAQALGQSLRNAGVCFDAVFASPLERAKQTAITMCQELNYPVEKIQFSEALEEVAQGQWEGRLRKEVYTPQVREIISSSQLDFHAPGGESQRQAEFRMVEFLTKVILPLAGNGKDHADCFRIGRSDHELQVQPAELGVESPTHGADLDCVANGDRNVEVPNICSALDELRPFNVAMEAELLRTTDRPSRGQAFRGAVVTHGHAMKCLLRGLLGSDPHMTRRFTIDNTSVTVLRHSTITGWQIQRVNDTSHLRALKGARHNR